MKPILFILACLTFSYPLFSQVEIEPLERYTNSYQNRDPKGDVYLVVAFDNNGMDYYFGKSDSLILTVAKKGAKEPLQHRILRKSGLFKNLKSKLWEYYHPLGKTLQLTQLETFTLYLVSIDSMNFSKTVFSDSDKAKLLKTYSPPPPNASNKEKLNYYKRTGDRQGELMGEAPILEVVRRPNCTIKKRKFRKEGINGQKEMIYGF